MDIPLESKFLVGNKNHGGHSFVQIFNTSPVVTSLSLMGWKCQNKINGSHWLKYPSNSLLGRISNAIHLMGWETPTVLLLLVDKLECLCFSEMTIFRRKHVYRQSRILALSVSPTADPPLVSQVGEQRGVEQCAGSTGYRPGAPVIPVPRHTHREPGHTQGGTPEIRDIFNLTARHSSFF